MPVEVDDRGLNIIGANTRALKFFDDSRNLRAEIYLDTSGQLNIAGATSTVLDAQGVINAESGYLGNLDVSGVLTVDDEGGFWLGSSGSFVNPGTGVKIGFVGTSPRAMGYKDGIMRSYMSTNVFYLNADYSDSVLYFGYATASNVGHYIGAGASGLIITTNNVNLDTSADDLTIQSTNGRAIFYSAKGMIFQNYAEASPSLSAGYFFNSATYASAGDYGTVTIRAQDAAARNINVDAGPSSFAQLRIEQPTLFAGSAKTVASAYTAYIGGAPVAGANVTLTQSHSLYVDGLTTITSGLNIGAATGATPNVLEVGATTGGATPELRFTDGDVSQPFSAFSSGYFGGLTEYSTTAGGLNIRGVSDADATSIGLAARVGAASTTVPAIVHSAGKHNGSGGAADLANDEIHSRWVKLSSGTTLATIFGNGTLSLAGGLNIGAGAGAITGAVSMAEITAPSAPAANSVYIYAEDNGAGKTRLMALFSSGAAQQLAIQP